MRPAPKVIDHGQGEHQKHMHSREDIANECAVHIAKIRMNPYFAHLSKIKCKCQHHGLWVLSNESSRGNGLAIVRASFRPNFLHNDF